MSFTKYEINSHGDVQTLVIGEHNTVNVYYTNGRMHTVPYLAPRVSNYGLIGRDDLLKEIKKYAFQNLAIPICGLPGMGKTSLAATFSRENLKHFPDGVLWAGLGPQANDQTMLAALGVWAAILNISAKEMNSLKTIELRAKAITAAIGTRRMILVADDIWDVKMALSFRIGGPNCVVLITTRIPKVADAFGEGIFIKVEELSLENGLRLLSKIARTTIEIDSEAASKLVESVSGCPMAIVLLGNKLRAEARTMQPRRIKTLLEKFNDVKERLSVAEYQDPSQHPSYLPQDTPLSLKAAIAVSVEPLEEKIIHTLKALSSLPPKPNTISEKAAFEIADATPEIIDQLLDSGLLESSGEGRYSLHQTITDYTQSYINIPDVYLNNIKRRIVHFFANFCQQNTGRDPQNLRAIDLEFQNIFSAINKALKDNLYSDYLRCSLALYGFLEIRGVYKVAEEQLKTSLKIAKAIGDTQSSLSIISHLGSITEKAGNYVLADQYYQDGLEMARKERNMEIVTYLLQNIGVVASKQGSPQKCEHYLGEALKIARQLDDSLRISVVLKNLGAQTVRIGDFKLAKTYLLEAFEMTKNLEDRSRHAGVLMNLGFLYINLGDYYKAENYITEGLDIEQSMGHHDKISLFLTYLGLLDIKRGSFSRAKTNFTDGLVLARRIGQKQRISLLLAYLGHLAILLRDYEQADSYLQEGLSLAQEIDNGENICTSLIFLGSLYFCKKNYEKALSYYDEAKKVSYLIGYKRLLAILLNEVGELYLSKENLMKASENFHDSLRLAEEMEHQELIAKDLYGLARLEVHYGNLKGGLISGENGFKIFEKLGHYQTREVREWLSQVQ